jgi:acetyl-CoA carboxylase biotin carboxyl carrier protein
MDLSYLKKIIKILEQSSVSEMEIEEEGIKLRLVKTSNNQLPLHQGFPTYHIPPAISQPYEASSPIAEKAITKMEEKPEEPVVTYHELKSPIVGTFYRAPAPDADPYVEVGHEVEPGTVLCIVEAMKLMNEIESDVRGKIVKVLVENSQPVEYNQTLFLIEPTK